MKEKNPIPVIYIKEHELKLITLVDPETNVPRCYGPINSKKRRIGGQWVAMYQDTLTWLATQRLTGEQSSVLFALLGILDYKNYIRISQADIAKQTGIKRPNVARAIKKLANLDIIAEGPRAGMYKTYILNPTVGIKGTQKNSKIVDYKEAKAARAREKQAELSAKQQDQDDSDKSDT